MLQPSAGRLAGGTRPREDPPRRTDHPEAINGRAFPSSCATVLHASCLPTSERPWRLMDVLEVFLLKLGDDQLVFFSEVPDPSDGDPADLTQARGVPDGWNGDIGDSRTPWKFPRTRSGDSPVACGLGCDDRPHPMNRCSDACVRRVRSFSTIQIDDAGANFARPGRVSG